MPFHVLHPASRGKSVVPAKNWNDWLWHCKVLCLMFGKGMLKHMEIQEEAAPRHKCMTWNFKYDRVGPFALIVDESDDKYIHLTEKSGMVVQLSSPLGTSFFIENNTHLHEARIVSRIADGEIPCAKLFSKAGMEIRPRLHYDTLGTFAIAVDALKDEVMPAIDNKMEEDEQEEESEMVHTLETSLFAPPPGAGGASDS